MSDKEALRRQSRETRLAMPSEEVAAKSAVIIDRLQTLVDQFKPKIVHCFEPMLERKEVDVAPLVEALRKHRPAPALYTSRQMNGWWQIVSLADDQPVYRQPSFDCIIVPMLGFDKDTLHRLGNGGGYYDRFLSGHPKAHTIGVCYESGKLTDFPSKPYDVALDFVVTEKQVYQRPS